MGERKGGEEGEQINNGVPPSQALNLDAGALFVLKSKGSWLHCGYHLTTSIVAPALLSLPLALAALGWAAGVIFLLTAAAVTFYSYNLISLVLENQAQLGRRQLRFRDMAHQILGPIWARYYIGPIQFLVCFGAVVGNILLGGQSMKATAAPPVQGKMFKGLCLCYAVAVSTFFSVAVSGYWAFGNLAEGTIISNFIAGNGRPLVPKWFLLMTNVFTIIQLSAVAVVYLQPTNEVLEGLFADPKKEQYSARNVVPRIVFRSVSVVTATVIAAMLPFFGDINAVIGAFGFLPLDFVVPAVLYNITFRPSKRGAIFWANALISVIFSVFAVLASVAAVRQIVLDAKSYKLFANV